MKDLIYELSKLYFVRVFNDNKISLSAPFNAKKQLDATALKYNLTQVEFFKQEFTIQGVYTIN